MPPAVARKLRELLLAWYAKVRRDLPWRRTRDPYAVWLSETMLQQTRVETVVPYFDRFMSRLPTLASLAEAPLEQVLGLWSGLGYYRRARFLHAAARQVVSNHGGRLPTEPEDLRRLAGVGAYTAGAVASIAFGRRAAVVDGNVARVVARLFAVEDDIKSASGNRRLWRLAEDLLPSGDGDPGDWNQALMELGATVCVPRNPDCRRCPIRRHCSARARGITSELPRATPHRPSPEVQHTAIVLVSRHAVLLARRRIEVLFGGLWEPPRGSGRAESVASRLRADPAALTPVGMVTHVLTHRRMQVKVLRGDLGTRRRFTIPSPDYDAIETVALSRLCDRPLSRLTTRILEVANVTERGLV